MQKDKRMQYEGSPIAQMVQATRKVGRNFTSTMRLATITSPPPDIKMLIDNDPIEYDKNDIYVAEYLTKHTRNVRIRCDKIEGFTMVAANHVHGYDWIDMLDAQLTYLDLLKTGDRVLVECDEENDIYIIVDRVVSYK